MINKFLAFCIYVVLSLSTHYMVANENAPDNDSKKHHSHESQDNRLANYAVLSNQVAVSDGENIPWSPSATTISEGISVDGLGRIRLPHPGLYLIEYTVRLTKSPFEGTATATVQLQQTISPNNPVNITQSTVTSNTSVDGLSNDVPESQTQITGYALINVSKSSNSVINLAVSITGGNLAIPATSGIDANAQMVILQLR